MPEGVLRRLAREVGRQLLAQAPAAWRWKGRDVKIADGTTVSMPDTPTNQAAWPQPSHERPGLGFPLARLMVVFSLAVGTVLDAALGPCRGKGTGETALFRSLHACLCPGDVVLSDRYFCSYFEIALLQELGVDAVMRLHQRQPVDFRRGRRLGRDDHLVVWTKPKRPEWMDETTYQRLPDTLTIRQVRLRVAEEGFRTKTLVVATTLRDPRGAHGQREQDHHAGQGETNTRLLGVGLGESLLVGRRIGHGDRGAVHHFQRASRPTPERRHLRLRPLAGLADQASEHGFGEAATRLAVGRGIGGAGGESLAQPPGAEAGDGLAAALGGIENLGEEYPQGQGRAEEPVAEADLFGLDNLLDRIGRQDVGKG